MMLKFESAAKYAKGMIVSLLARSWTELWNNELQEKMAQFDRTVFENIDTVGACVFVSTFNEIPVGMASWDPRQRPHAIIGYNCILPEYQNRGFGQAQIQEILRRLKEQGFKKVTVTTADHSFFGAARKMYQACGFKENRRYCGTGDRQYRSIEFVLNL